MNDVQASRRRPTTTAALLALPPLLAAALVGVTLRHHEYNEPFFVESAYGALLSLVVLYAGVRLAGLGPMASLRAFVVEHRPGLLVAAAVSAVAVTAVPPAFRVLADEANLVGVSKNLFFHHTANFAVTGKWYFGNYWNLNETTDRRPALFPFLVSLVHGVRGYRPENAFVLNVLVFVLFVFTSYRVATSLGGVAFGVAAGILVATSPNTLVAARSAGFDFVATFMLLAVVQSVLEHARAPSPRRLAVVCLHLCLLAHVRYEGWALLAVSAVVLAALGLARASHRRGFGWLYATLPLLLLPRYWQMVAKAHDAEQPLSASLFGVSHFVRNAGAYLRLALHPVEVEGPHSPLLLILGAMGCAIFVVRFVRRASRGEVAAPERNLWVFVTAILAMETVLCFSYSWGDPVHAASARLFIWLDTFLAFAAAWLLAALGRAVTRAIAADERWAVVPAGLAAAALFVVHLPTASDARFVNALILTRQAAQTWAFLDSLGSKRILVLSDRPGLFTIKDFGAMDISTADSDRSPLIELSRHLYDDIYLVQEVELETEKPLAGFAPWPDVEKTTVFEFQNTESASVRIARVNR
jgi:hypothetical protein